MYGAVLAGAARDVSSCVIRNDSRAPGVGTSMHAE